MNTQNYSILLKDYINRNKTIIIYSIIIAIVCYGYELFNFSFSIDEELDSFTSAIDLKRRILRGRWGIYLINIFLFPHSVIPYLPTLISILGVALTAILFINSEKCDLRSKIVFCTIFISFPLHSYYMAFNFFNYYVGIGMVLSVISYLMVKRALEGSLHKKILYLLAIPLLTVSISIYQGMIPIFIFMALVHILLLYLNEEFISKKEIIKRITGSVLVFCCSFLLFKLIEIGLKYLFFHSIHEKDIYMESFNSWGILPDMQNITSLIKSTIWYLLGKRFYGGFALGSTLIFIPFLFFIILKNVKGGMKKTLSLFILIAIILCPFFVMYYLGTPLPPRSLIALPLFLALIWWLSYQYLKPWLKKIMLLAAFLLFFSNTYQTTRLFYTNYVSWQADRDMANRIIERIYSLDLPEAEQIQVAFIGKYDHPGNELFFKTNDIFGASFFYWDNGNPDRMNGLFKSIGINNLRVVPQNIRNKISESVDSMPCWPQKGSVALSGDIVVVKLSDINK
jgi:hypothetical protein